MGLKHHWCYEGCYEEGVIQGCPVSMVAYAILMIPLLESLKLANYTQTVFADDVVCAASAIRNII